MTDNERMIQLLKQGEIQYKFTIALSLLYSGEEMPRMDYHDTFVWGRQTYHKDELELTEKEEKDAVSYLSYNARYILAVQIDSVLEELLGKKRFCHRDDDIKSLSHIVRLIRNSYSHNPFYPKWLIHHKDRNKCYVIKSIDVVLDTSKLNGQFVTRRDCGGPLAVLRMSEIVRAMIEAHTS
jgi:hypothetical protein